MSKYVIVTTEHRGVFGGYGPTAPDGDGRITLTEARMCIYWPESVKGVLGLAVTGPLEGSKIGPAVPSMTLTGVTSVMEATDDAHQKWDAAPWG